MPDFSLYGLQPSVLGRSDGKINHFDTEQVSSSNFSSSSLRLHFGKFITLYFNKFAVPTCRRLFRDRNSSTQVLQAYHVQDGLQAELGGGVNPSKSAECCDLLSLTFMFLQQVLLSVP